jgi:hypothetical protein
MWFSGSKDISSSDCLDYFIFGMHHQDQSSTKMNYYQVLSYVVIHVNYTVRYDESHGLSY